MKGSALWKIFICTGTMYFFMMICNNSTNAIIAHKPQAPASNEKEFNLKQLNYERKELFDKISLVTGIPWNLLAAVDQYEYTIHQFKKRKSPEPQGLISIQFSDLKWVGMLNPDHEDNNLNSIRIFKGIGQDGSGDGLADEHNPMDRLVTMTTIMLKRGKSEEDIRLSLWDHYQNSRSVQRIDEFAKIYAAQGSLDVYGRAFPLPVNATLSYRDTWGANRGWGGHRSHEGTDIFAGYGVQVRSTCHGIIEVMGWNPYGGWRIGIRDIGNVYHYYAHLSRYAKALKVGDVVKPGQLLGFVGSSGYGKKGTTGKFPPHLHYGMYRDGGLSDWSFDPYPYLKRWEREDRKNIK